MADQSPDIGLDAYFTAVADFLRKNQASLNKSDPYNGDHGDHMVQIFLEAAESARGCGLDDLPAAMEMASRRLAELVENGSAILYSRGLAHFAAQFRAYEISLPDLLTYLNHQLSEHKQSDSSQAERQDAPVTKALLAGLVGWKRNDCEPQVGSGGLNLDMLFELGLHYFQAKVKGGSKVEILAETAASVSPLAEVPYRRQSGKIALQTLLQVMAARR